MNTEHAYYKNKIQMTLYFLKGTKRFFLLGILFAGILSFLEMINPKVISYTVDAVIGEEEGNLPAFLKQWIAQLGGEVFLREHLHYIALFVIAVAMLAAFSRYLFGVCNARGAEGLVKKMRDSLYRHILSLPYSWHSENSTGDIIQRCTSDVETIKRFLSEQLTGLFRTLVMTLMGLYFMFEIHGSLALAASVFIPIVVGYSLHFHTQLGSAFEKVDIEEGNLSTIAQENLTGVRVVRAFGRERYEKERFEAKNEEYTGMWIHLMKVMSRFWAANDLISGFQIMIVLTLGAYFCVTDTLTAGQYIAFISYNAMLVWPVRNLGRVISELSKAGISISRIMYIMNARSEEEILEGLSQDTTPKENNDIEFQHVTFSFDKGAADVLKDVSIVIPEGKTVGILGGTGSGKSTLVHLLTRLYELEPANGRIMIGGRNIRSISTGELRKKIGFVLQEPYLFSRSLGENIALGLEKCSQSQIEDAAKLACLEHTIEKFANQYDTLVGERGVTLSGGQKQRTAIAQMMIRKPQIMIFDDSLSAVDSQTDSRIRHMIKEHTKNTTVILISHRITTLMQADIIYVLDKGAIVESGTHEQLLVQNGLYKKIYELQKGAEYEAGK